MIMPLVLSLPRAELPSLPIEGCWGFAAWSNLPSPVWRERSALEHDESLLQLIPYVALRNSQGQLWAYTRTGGDARLEGRCSCGVGGHVEIEDQAADLRQTLTNTACREMAEELGLARAGIPALSPCALIYESHSAIGRVHLGVLFVADWRQRPSPCPPAHESLRGLGFLTPATIADDPRFERWSRMVAEFVSMDQTCNNQTEEKHGDSTTNLATAESLENLARTASRHRDPAASISSGDRQHDPEFDGDRAGTCAAELAGASPCGNSTRPIDATRELATSQGQKTYTEVSAYLAVNIVRTLENLLDNDPEQIAITPEWIKNTHRQFAGNLFPEWAGRFRMTEVQVGTHFPPPPYDVPVQVKNYCLDLETRMAHLDSPESVAHLLAWADWRFQWIHPFKDFNGRIGRILLVALCYKLNLPPANPAADDASRLTYFNALRRADEGDFSALNNLWLERLSA